MYVCIMKLCLYLLTYGSTFIDGRNAVCSTDSVLQTHFASLRVNLVFINKVKDSAGLAKL